MKIKFEKGNNILCYQDMRWFRGAPTDVEFRVDKIIGDKIWLKAPNYGESPYGNGCLAIYIKNERIDGAQATKEGKK